MPRLSPEEFESLQRVWYERLAEDGFEDIEVNDGFRCNAMAHYMDADEAVRMTREEYYLILSQQIEVAEFRHDVDRVILTRAAEGKKIKDICEELDQRGQRRCRNTVTFTIRTYEMKWGLRTYSPKQLNKKTA